MELTHDRWLPRSPMEVWRALNDPGVLQDCMPGCERVERKAEDLFEATILAHVGPVKARFIGEVRIVDPQPPSRYTLAFSGAGRALGAAGGHAFIHIDDDAGGARLRYHTEVTVEGRLARLGRRFVDAAARRLTDRFFDRFVERLRIAPGDDGTS